MKKRKGQITVFIALGIMIIFIFLFLIQMNRNLVEAQLRSGQEDVFSKVFKKESLRIFVEDCLRDELREAIILVGRQGRIWGDQAGGTTMFTEQSGRHIAEQDARVSYSLTYQPYINFPEAYPCRQESGEPSFCQFSHPSTQGRFGKIQRWEHIFERDIGGALKVKAQACIDNYLTEKVPGASFDPGDFTLNVDLREEGVAVEAFYPLGFNVDGEDFFHLSVFDFFYPSKLKKFMRAVYLTPLQRDWQYVDYHYTPETLTSPFFSYLKEDFTTQPIPTFSEDVENLEVDVQRKVLDNGDTLYTFETPFPHVLDTPQKYTLNVLRQNRPPALDYVHRAECPQGDVAYDYLVVPGDEELGNISIRLTAKDPDDDLEEEVVDYWFDGNAELAPFITDSTGTSEALDTGIAGDTIFIESDVIAATFAPGMYEITSFASDQNSLVDKQLVRIFIGEAILADQDVRAELLMPYTYVNEDESAISAEDPILVGAKLPENSDAAEISISNLEYINSVTGETFNVAITDTGENCLNFPSGAECDFSSYTGRDVTEKFSSGTFLQKENYEKMIKGNGKIKVEFGLNYCGGENLASNTHEIDVQVKKCLPHRSSTHPWPYIPGTEFYAYEYSLDENGETDFSLNYNKISGFSPLMADHTCCTDSFEFEANGVPCFRSPEPDCGARFSTELLTYGDAFQTKIQQQLVATCDGEHGNICGADSEHQSRQIVDDKLKCGVVSADMPTCTDIEDKCENKPAWSYIDSSNSGTFDSWCHGVMGCTALCVLRPTIRAGANTFSAEFWSLSGVDVLNTYATNKMLNEDVIFGNNNEFGLTCGCQHAADKCDFDFSGNFDGTCNNNGQCCLGGVCER